jgi:D-arabinose 1-dehydrogenase-like Zn-dependent alcohol dehydrogenase
MKALVAREFGDAQKLKLELVDEPVINPDSSEVLVRVKACGICYHDLVTLAGKVPWARLPLIMGHEIAGDVVAVGSKVKSVSPGDRIASLQRLPCGICKFCQTGRENLCRGVFLGEDLPGGYAEYVKLNENSVVKLPDSIPYTHGSILACALGTNLRALRDRANVRPGDTVLITGAGGGLGLHCIQVAKLLGAKVIAVTSSENKVNVIYEMGADEVIVSPNYNFSDEAKRLTQGEGVNVVAEIAGSISFEASLRSLAPNGKLVLIGDPLVKPVELRPTYLIYKELEILASASTTKSELIEVVKLVQQGLLRPFVSKTYRLEEAAAAFSALKDKKSIGRVVFELG